MQDKQIEELIKKYQAGEATDEEIAFLETWYLTHNESDKTILRPGELVEDASTVWSRLLPAKRSANFRSILPWFTAAACLLLFFYFCNHFISTTTPKKHQLTQHKPSAILPGSSKAILTLANGRKIILTDSGNGNFGKQGNTSISKTANGQLIYKIEPGATKTTAALVYNTITTPLGGQYWIVLSDGTRVFLNAGSSLRYPTSFNGNERKVELQGEAYFEVAHNNKAPFRIATDGQVVEDIGTSFNINGYGDEPVMKTTLIEGAVKVSTTADNLVLKPGQQAQVDNANLGASIKLIKHANLKEVLAWKNGLFEFDNSTIKQVMNSTSRWYDFKVIYENKVPDIKISGRISRNVDFSGLIALLKFEGVKFSIEGRNVTIKN